MTTENSSAVQPIAFAHFKPPGGGANVGDHLGKYMVETLSGRQTEDADAGRHPEILLTVGSIINDRLPDQCTFWGSGMLRQQDAPNAANRFLAVRGPLTQARLRQCGVEPPRALGDPALLMPLIYRPKAVGRRYRMGVVPHYVDLGPFVQRARASMLENRENCIVLKTATDRVEDFIDALVSCDLIVSSSLHGVILAQAYGVPALWVQFSNRVIGQGFKFRDYFLSVSIEPYEGPLLEDGELKLEDLAQLAQQYPQQLEINNFDPLPLLRTCPFITEEKRAELIHRAVASDTPLGWISRGTKAGQLNLEKAPNRGQGFSEADSMRPQSDVKRWSELSSFQNGWAHRSAMAASWVPKGSRLLDIGCGTMFLEKYLDPTVTYWPADLVARDERTRICDANQGVLPPEIAQADVITFLGVLEYLFDVPALLRQICRKGVRVILTYCDRESSNFGRSDRAEHGWVNSFTIQELEALARAAGFEVLRRQRVDDAQWMLELLA